MEKIRVDFSDTPESEYAVPGKYKARVKSTALKQGDKAKYIEWTLEILTGASKGRTIIHRTSLAPNALFGLRDMLVAMGFNVPNSAVSIDPDKFINKTLGIEVAMRPYEGKEYANVVKVFVYEATTKAETVATDTASLYASEPVGADDEVSIDLE